MREFGADQDICLAWKGQQRPLPHQYEWFVHVEDTCGTPDARGAPWAWACDGPLQVSQLWLWPLDTGANTYLTFRASGEQPATRRELEFEECITIV